MTDMTEEELAIARGDVVADAKQEDTKAAAADNVDADEAARKAAEEAEAAGKDDEEGVETDEERAEREAAEAAERAEAEKKKRARIPLERHEATLAKARAEAEAREKALAARIAELEKSQKAPEKTQRDQLSEMKAKIDELQDKYEAHVFEGEKDEAKKVRMELDAARERYTDAKVALSGAAARNQTIEALKYEQALANVESRYPALNPDHEDYDSTKEDEVADLMEMFAKNGHNRFSALEKAVKYVLGSPKERQEAAVDTTAKTLADKRAKEAREKAAAASKAQPPSATGVGKDNDKAGDRTGGLDFSKLTQAQFEKLDEAALAKARGDEL